MRFGLRGSLERQKNFTGEHFWPRRHLVSTVGLDENLMRAYIRNQEDEDGQSCCIVPKKHVAVAPKMLWGTVGNEASDTLRERFKKKAQRHKAALEAKQQAQQEDQLAKQRREKLLKLSEKFNRR